MGPFHKQQPDHLLQDLDGGGHWKGVQSMSNLEYTQDTDQHTESILSGVPIRTVFDELDHISDLMVALVQTDPSCSSQSSGVPACGRLQRLLNP